MLFAIKVIITAASAGNPNDSNKGAAKAAGVPNPADASINEPKSHEMIIACILRSGDIALKPLFIAANAPHSLRVNNKVRAPKTINIIFKAITAPLRLDAKIQFNGVSQIKTTITRAKKKDSGIALVAGQRNPTISIKIMAIGVIANNASIPVDIVMFLFFKYCLFYTQL
ncbi:hypothetical protein GCM10011412_37940 [Maribacter cobaltidurans]|nr:hypothetical protein GCM10011412_37940 [Maribacter cobaltidurans]